MLCRRRSLFSLLVVLSSIATWAQYPGQNINMVSGTIWPAGDPFLQRQNEPSMAVSSRNGQHLLGGANDYRTVDIANPNAANILGDAWVGVYTSLDGGDTWKSTLLPGYPQDTSSVGMASPLHNFTVATDPTVRAGTHGLFYYSGLAFNRGSNAPSGVFVATFQDLNNKGNGDAAILASDGSHGNPFQYLGVSMIDTGTSGQFLDKPWIAVDIPRPGRTATCKINGQTISSGYVYIVYTQFNGSQKNPASKIKTSVSTNCGVTWSQPQILSQSMKLAQGTVAAIDPTNGNVMIAWRQIYSSANQPDAIQYAISTNGGTSFSNYPAAYTFVAPSASYPQFSAFDQPSASPTAFRTLDVPTLAIDASGRAWLAFSVRVNGPTAGTYGSRIMVMTLPEGARSWTTPMYAEGTASLTRYGHEFMPSFTFAYGKLALAWFDTRRDNMQSIVSCPGGGCNNFAGGTVKDVPIPASSLDPSAGTPNPAAVFTPTISDSSTGIRHTMDVFGAVIDPSKGPSAGQFAAFQVSQYPYYVNDNDNQLEQGFFNPPNLPMFVQGTTPFVGDYIDIAGQWVVPSGNSWAFNTQPTDPATGATIAPDFHVTWTDNRDVVPPPIVSGKQDWTQYQPPNSGFSSTSTYSGTGNACPAPMCTTTEDACTTVSADNNTTASYSGDRNQNVYTSRLTNGLLVQFKENAKPSATVAQRAFSLLVRNTVPPLSTTPYDSPAFFRVSLDANSCAIASIGAPNTCSTDIQVYPDTTQTPQITVNYSTQNPSVKVVVQQITGINGTVMNPGLQAVAVINGDPSNPAVVDADFVVPDDSNPDIETQYPGNLISQGEEYYPTVDGPPDPTPTNDSPTATIGVPEVFQPVITTAADSVPMVSVNTPKINTPKINTPKIASLQIANPTIVDYINTPKITSINTPKINTPKIASPDIFTPKITNLADNSLTDFTWKVNNKGNTSSSYSTSEFVKSSGVNCCPASCSGPNPPASCSSCSVCQLIQHKVYESPVANRDASNMNATCDLTVQQFSITVANIPDPAFGSPSGALGTNNTSTLSLSPGEGNRVTLRVVGQPNSNTVAPFKTQATSLGPNSSSSLILSTSALPVAIVGQNYPDTFLTASGGVGTAAWSVPTDINNPVAATLPITPEPLPVTELTLSQSGEIAPALITSTPGTYTANLQVQDSASTPSLDVQQVPMYVNSFTITSVDPQIANEVGSTGYMKAGDQATVAVTITNNGPADATSVLPTLTVNTLAGGTPSGPTPVVSCIAPTAVTICGSTSTTNSCANLGTATFNFTCTATGGNGYVSFTANATGQYVNSPAATVVATAAAVTQPATDSSTPPNIIVDTTNPTLTFSAANPSPNPYGWNNSNVTFPYSTGDNLAGVKSSLPSPSLVISTEGKAVTGTVTVTDYANNAQTFTSSPVNLDKTAPTLSVTSATTPLGAYAAGTWTNQNVTVSFACNDTLSGPLYTTTPSVIQNPVITGLPASGASVTYAISPDKLTTTATVLLTAETAGTTLSAACQDFAGNPAPLAAFGPIMIDKTPPVLTVSAKNGQGNAYTAGTWTNQSVSVTYACTDAASSVANSGVAASYPTGSQTFTTQSTSAGYSTSGSCKDNAGNVSTNAPLTFSPILIDQTNPTLTFGSPTPSANAYGWNNTLVQIPYGPADALSGVATATPGSPLVFNSQGTAQTQAVTVTDKAGNAQQFTSPAVSIDLTPPTVVITSPASVAYINNQPITASYTCGDSGGSGLLTCLATNGTISGNTFTQSTPGGPYTFTVAASDKAGNASAPSIQYSTVYYAFTGFAAPLAGASQGSASSPSQTPTTGGTFPQGTTIPFLWTLATPAGTANPGPVIDPSTLTGVTAYPYTAADCSSGIPTTGAISLFPAVTPNTFAYDAANQRFAFNWNTGTTAPGCYYMVMTFNDLSSYATNIIISAGGTSNALNFDGTSGNTVDGTNTNLPQGNSARTIEAWINPSTTTSGTIFSYGTAGNNAVFGLQLNNNVLYLTGGGNDIQGSIPIPANQWTHVAVSYDGTAIASLYVNGALDTSTTVGTGTGNGFATAGNTWRIGDLLGATTPPAGQPFIGSIDEIRVWSTARTASNIVSDMTGELCVGQTGLVAYYKFNTGNAGGNNSGVTTLTDVSASGSTGALNNFKLTGKTSNWVQGNAPVTGDQLTLTLSPASLTFSMATPTPQPVTAIGSCTDGSTPDLTGLVTWMSVDPTVATVDASGNVTPVAQGATSITAAAADTTASAGVTVGP